MLDTHRLAWGDLTGNNRLDSFGNLVEQPNVGLLFIVPGVEETLRLCGSAALCQDPEILDACTIGDRRPKTAVVVTVQECYIQCGAALRRSGLWDTASWPTDEAKPSGAAILKDHIGTEATVEQIAAGLADYRQPHLARRRAGRLIAACYLPARRRADRTVARKKIVERRRSLPRPEHHGDDGRRGDHEARDDRQGGERSPPLRPRKGPQRRGSEWIPHRGAGCCRSGRCRRAGG